MAGPAECCAVITIRAGGHSCCSAADGRPLLEGEGRAQLDLLEAAGEGGAGLTAHSPV